MSNHWKHLEIIAKTEVNSILAILPPDLKKKAAPLPVTYQPRPSAELVADGVEADTLGMFVGEPFPESESGALQLPPQIILYLENLWDLAEGDEAYYREEVRATYLHELGHYLGLDEDDLEERGLD
jgi:predicted Zn-dependent protease with MMP-like domain